MGNVRQPIITLNPLVGGYSNVLASFISLDPLTDGVPKVKLPLIIVESLHPIAPEPYMSTTPFPGFGNSISNPAIPAALDPFSSGLPGLDITVHKKPMFKTNINQAASGNEIRTAMQSYPLWEFDLTYNFLEDRSGANSSLKTILGFFLQMLGSWDSWLFKDPDDYLVTGGVCGTSDGVTTQFTFCRTLGGFREPVGQVDTANTINVYRNGVLISPSAYTVTMPNKIVFTSAPAAGTITADFQFFYVCRFLEDQQDYEKFADKLWALQTCTFRSILQ